MNRQRIFAREKIPFLIRASAVFSVLVLLFAFAGCGSRDGSRGSQSGGAVITLENIPGFSGRPYVELYNNVPDFADSELKADPFEMYDELDPMGRCVRAYACVCEELMPTEERGSIGQVKPSGWHTVKYDNVDGKYLYNRCHLIGYQLTAENANEKNLITGTRYLNIEGMLPFENMVADYIKETGNHVLYRVTPVFLGGNLLASGVQIEAKSVEDGGDGILFNVYCYNVQPGIAIDYATGESELADGTSQGDGSAVESTASSNENFSAGIGGETYILNKSTKKFHLPDCAGVAQIKKRNKEKYTGAREELIAMGYEPCATCKP